ncbi:uncharacterized protein FIBRA_04334 [Fibroporia radiculosa]|uniref:3,4-dihydroxy-2-butanone 4-phosphate synthase n=1 Tax=Fibroporia radiculosa TaxID=599839 RepID=J4IA41_9APHY|nr:uncharacterized protein FIBRA_04334 [Fibroporia radiculosa]CCM02251.1 predicted protein [Fibroporia radiculosa]
MAPVATEASDTTSLHILKQPRSPVAMLGGHPHDLPQPVNLSRPIEVEDGTPRTTFEFDPMEDALAAFERGDFLVVMDDEGRENEGDLIIAASQVSTEKMAWMIKHTSGYICIALPGDRLDALAIPQMVAQNEDPNRTAYTVTVDYRPGTTTGISAHDRALTARALAAPSARPDLFSRPGHMVPLRARPGGVLARPGHTESAVDLCALTGLPPAGVLCELVEDNDAGSMMRRDACRRFADRWGLKMISVEMLAQWRRRTERTEGDTRAEAHS